jgi:hypothetical protein
LQGRGKRLKYVLRLEEREEEKSREKEKSKTNKRKQINCITANSG